MCRSQRRKGAIPASAGERRHPDPWRRSGWGYPRKRGERWRSHSRTHFRGGYPRKRGGTQCRSGHSVLTEGLSPQARGNGNSLSNPGYGGGAIPASAGERWVSCSAIWSTRGYPRKRGGTCTLVRLKALEEEAIPASAGERLLRRASVGGFWGLSPQARGNELAQAVGQFGKGAIPASAGERVRSCRLASRGWGYPRKRGGTMSPAT